MYILVNKSLGMSSGKMSAQCCHSAINVYNLSKPEIKKKWDEGSFTKVILGGKNEKELEKFIKLANSLGLNIFAVHDEGRTEIKAGSMTVVGLEIIDKDEHGKKFRGFSLLG